MHLMFILFLEPPSSCSIFKLHPGTFSFSIISDIFQAIFINSNSYQINWENAQIHVPKSRTKFIFFPPVERQTWSPRSFYHHLNGFSSIPSDGEQGSIHHLLYFNVLLFQFELNFRHLVLILFHSIQTIPEYYSIKNLNLHLQFLATLVALHFSPVSKSVSESVSRSFKLA